MRAPPGAGGTTGGATWLGDGIDDGCCASAAEHGSSIAAHTHKVRSRFTLLAVPSRAALSPCPNTGIYRAVVCVRKRKLPPCPIKLWGVSSYQCVLSQRSRFSAIIDVGRVGSSAFGML